MSRRVRDLVGLLARLFLGGVLLAAGVSKIGDLTGSVQAVVAYQLLDYELAEVIGATLPVEEIARDTGLFLAGAWLVVRPHTLGAVDTLITAGRR